MTVVLAQKFETIARTVAALNGFMVEGRRLTFEQIDDFMDEARRYANEYGYVKVSIPELDKDEPSVFVWAEDEVKIVKEYENGKVSFTVHEGTSQRYAELKYLLDTNKTKKVVLIRKGNEDEDDFYITLASHFNVTWDIIQTVLISDYNENSIKAAFGRLAENINDKSVFASYLKKELSRSIDASIETSLLSITEKPHYPGIEALAGLSSLLDKGRQAYIQSQRKHYSLIISAKKGECTVPLTFDRKFSSRKEAEDFASSLPHFAIAEEVCEWHRQVKAPGPFSRERLISSAMSDLEMSKERAENALLYLFKEGYISSPFTDCEKLPQGSSDQIFDRLSAFSNTASFGPYIPEMRKYFADAEYFSDGPDSGIIITEKSPAIEGTDNQALYRLIVFELMKIYYPPKEYIGNHIKVVSGTFECSGTRWELMYPGFSVLESNTPAPLPLFSISKGDQVELEISTVYTGEEQPDLITVSEFKDLLSASDKENADNILRTLESEDLIYIDDRKIGLKENALLLDRYLEKCKGLADGKILATVSNAAKEMAVMKEDQRKKTKDKLTSDLGKILTKYDAAIKAQKADDTALFCPECGGNIVFENSSYYCTRCGFSMPQNIGGKYLSDDEVSYLFAEGETPLMDGFDGNYLSRLYIDRGKVTLSQDSAYYCPECGNPLSVEKDTYDYVCRRCSYRLRRIYKSHMFSREEISKLLNEHFLHGVQVIENGKLGTTDIFLSRADGHEITENN